MTREEAEKLEEYRRAVDEWIEIYKGNGSPKPKEDDHSTQFTRLTWILQTMHGLIEYKRAQLTTQAQEVWEEAAKIAERPRILDALHGISGVTAEAREIAAELRSRIPPSIGGELKTQEHNDAN